MLFQQFWYQLTSKYVFVESSFLAFISLHSFTLSQFQKSSLTLLQQIYLLVLYMPQQKT